MTSKIAADKPGSFALLNGDEAVARGAVEATVKVAASYPGTPATEILETIAEVSKEFGIYAEWSINEIVATEVAAGASMTGVRSIVSMKHVGLNVAADAAMTLAYTGVEGGMVIAVCDDPALHSSQNEQDTRFFAVHSKLPLLDAGSPQEAHDMAKEAFEISEKLHLPVILRLTTRVAHGKARVKLGSFQKIKRKAEFDKDSSKWVMVPSNAIRQHRILEGRLAEAKRLANDSKFNVIEDNGSEIGIVGSGVGYYYARSVLDTKKFSWLKLGFVHPFPVETVKTFAKSNAVVLTAFCSSPVSRARLSVKVSAMRNSISTVQTLRRDRHVHVDCDWAVGLPLKMIEERTEKRGIQIRQRPRTRGRFAEVPLRILQQQTKGIAVARDCVDRPVAVA